MNEKINRTYNQNLIQFITKTKGVKYTKSDQELKITGALPPFIIVDDWMEEES